MQSPPAGIAHNTSVTAIQSPPTANAGGPQPPAKHQKPSQAALQQQREYALRNESYYMATNETWSPHQVANVGLLAGLGGANSGGHHNTSVLIEEDPEPPSP